MAPNFSVRLFNALSLKLLSLSFVSLLFSHIHIHTHSYSFTHSYTYSCTRSPMHVHAPRQSSILQSFPQYISHSFTFSLSFYVCFTHALLFSLSLPHTNNSCTHMHAPTLAHMHAHLPTHTREHTRTLSPLMSLLNTLSANTSSSFSLSSHCSALARWHDFDFELSLKFQTNSAEAIDSNLNINRLTQF